MARRLDQGRENRPRASVLLVGALGVPLYANDEVLGGSILDGFDDAVLWRTRDDAQSIARTRDRLMVR